MSRRRIAFYGGSFNPCHIGHQMTAMQALTLLDIDALVIAPAFVHAEGKKLDDYEHRLEMVRRMVRPFFGYDKAIFISRVEEHAYYRQSSDGLTSKALRQLEYTHPELKGAHVTLILGSDLKDRIAGWRGFDELADMIKAGDLSLFFVERWLDVSSTKIRSLYAESAEPEIRKMVPRDIHWYIQNHCLYR